MNFGSVNDACVKRNRNERTAAAYSLVPIPLTEFEKEGSSLCAPPQAVPCQAFSPKHRWLAAFYSTENRDETETANPVHVRLFHPLGHLPEAHHIPAPVHEPHLGLGRIRSAVRFSIFPSGFGVDRPQEMLSTSGFGEFKLPSMQNRSAAGSKPNSC